LAFDASGNIWVGAGTGFANGAVNEFNTAGQLILAPVTSATVAAYNLNYVVGGNITALSQPGSTSTLGYGRPNSIAIDTAGNAWFGAYGTASPGTYVNGATSVPTGVVAEVSPTGTVTGYLAGSNAGALAIDGNNDVFVGDIPQTGKYYISELPASSYQTLNAGNGRGSSIFNYVLADQSGNGIAFSSSATCTSYVVQRNNTAQEAAALASPVNTASDLTLPSNCAYAGAVDAAGNIWGVASGNLYYLNIAAGTVSMTTTTPVITTFTGSTNTAVATAGGQGGLDSPSGVALDGVGNVWVVNRLSSATSGANGVSEFVPTTTAAGVTTVTPLSPSAAGVYGFGSGAGIGGANQPVIDGSGNLWITTTAGSYLNFLVGVAAPVVTPTAVALKNNTIAVRP
jgi:sugar lactone lactonase YvrE